MKLKERLLDVLNEKKITYSDLTSHLGFSEKEFDKALENNSVEIRTLELISKELRISLYSFFRENADLKVTNKKSFYNVNSGEESLLKKEIEALKKEIENLKAQLHQSELLIQALEEQIVKK